MLRGEGNGLIISVMLEGEFDLVDGEGSLKYCNLFLVFADGTVYTDGPS